MKVLHGWFERGRVERGRCLLDLRCVPPDSDAQVADAVLAVRGEEEH